MWVRSFAWLAYTHTEGPSHYGADAVFTTSPHPALPTPAKPVACRWCLAVPYLVVLYAVCTLLMTTLLLLMSLCRLLLQEVAVAPSPGSNAWGSVRVSAMAGVGGVRRGGPYHLCAWEALRGRRAGERSAG